MEKLEHVVIIGAGMPTPTGLNGLLSWREYTGFNGLQCALEAQRQRPSGRQVDLVAQVFPFDRLPLKMTTGISVSATGRLSMRPHRREKRSYFQSLQLLSASFEEEAFESLWKLSEESPHIFKRFSHCEYYTSPAPRRILKLQRSEVRSKH